jgi:hypothetical protein
MHGVEDSASAAVRAREADLIATVRGGGGGVGGFFVLPALFTVLFRRACPKEHFCCRICQCRRQMALIKKFE